METGTSGTNEAQGQQVETDPWAAAFAALEQVSTGDPSGTANTGGDGMVSDGELGSANESDQSEANADENASDDNNADETTVGGLGDYDGSNGEENGNAFSSHIGVTEESIKQYEQELDETIENRAMREVAQELIKRGFRHTDGRLGVTLDDSDICKRDEDGVPRFYNPETGREFSGDNPRRQAQEWVDDYNRELARVYNDACNEYEQYLRSEYEPQLAVMKFAPKYDKLDDIRRGMFDNVIEDYEIKDKQGNIVGYNCDLDKALALVDRQIEMIQGYARQHQQQQPAPQAQQSNGPALDMKTSSGAVQGGKQSAPTSLEEAMEHLQDAELEKLKRN